MAALVEAGCQPNYGVVGTGAKCRSVSDQTGRCPGSTQCKFIQTRLSLLFLYGGCTTAANVPIVSAGTYHQVRCLRYIDSACRPPAVPASSARCCWRRAARWSQGRAPACTPPPPVAAPQDEVEHIAARQDTELLLQQQGALHCTEEVACLPLPRIDAVLQQQGALHCTEEVSGLLLPRTDAVLQIARPAGCGWCRAMHALALGAEMARPGTVTSSHSTLSEPSPAAMRAVSWISCSTGTSAASLRSTFVSQYLRPPPPCSCGMRDCRCVSASPGPSHRGSPAKLRRLRVASSVLPVIAPTSFSTWPAAANQPLSGL